MKSGKAAPKNDGARAKTTRGKKGGFISKKESTEETTPPVVSMKEENSLQAMHSKIQKQLNDKDAPDAQMQAEEKTDAVQAQEDDVQKTGDEEMK